MSKITIIEGNSNDKDNVRTIMVKGEKGEQGDLNHNDIIDNLTSSATDKVLSANQGKALKTLIDNNATTVVDETTARTNADVNLQSQIDALTPRITANESNITTEATARTNADANLQSQINALGSGSPLVASSTAGMTDTTKVYVNTSDGKWYYYNGSSWVAGGTYQGTSISEDTVEVKNLNTTLKGIINSRIPTFTIINGYYRNGSNINATSGFSYTSAIQLFKGETIKAKLKGYSNNVTLMSLVDSNNTWLTEILQSVDNTPIYCEYTAGEDCYVSLCTNTSVSYEDIAIYRKNVNESVNEPSYNYLTVPFGTVTKGKYIRANGDAIDYVNNKLLVTDYIEVLPNTKYILKDINWTSNDNSCYAFYDKNKNFISSVNNTINIDFEYITPVNAHYVRHTIKEITYGITKLYIEKNINALVKSINKNIEINSYCDLSLFKKFGVIGDSFASGELYFNNSYVDKYDVSWGQILARKKGTTCTNYSKGGLSTRTWLTSDKGLSLLNTNPAEDIYYCALGINDYYHLGIDYLGSLTDITSYESSEDYGDTFYGNYGRIIEAIQNHAPNSKIIMFTCANDTGVAHSFNEAIKEIANHYNIPYIVQKDDDFFQSSTYTNMAGGHPRAVAYSGMANAFERLLTECILNNSSYFNDTFMY